jgi:hypothetical protein
MAYCNSGLNIEPSASVIRPAVLYGQRHAADRGVQLASVAISSSNKTRKTAHIESPDRSE